MDARTVGELGESAVLARILVRLGETRAAKLGPGDDCAVLGFTGDAVVTTDTMIEGPDFRLAWHDGFALGWKLAATNLSDVAAMGAEPAALTVALACPRETPVALLEEIARGLDAACRELAPGCGVVGGDLGRAPVLTAAVTALGDLAGRSPITRSGAQPGDVVAYAGDLGLAGLGLALLFEHCTILGGAKEAGVATSAGLAELRSAHPVEIAAQLAPRPPIALGVAAALAGATAMMDVSDGLALDASRLARASGCTVDLHSARLLRAFGTQRGVRVPLAAMLEGGEDQGLLATFPPVAMLPSGFEPVGLVGAPAADARPVTVDGEPQVTSGWDPYTGSTDATRRRPA